MSKFKKYTSTIVVVLALIVTAIQGCKKDFLEVSPQGSLTGALFPKTAADALLATNGIYAQMRVWQYHSGGFPILDIMSDDTRKGSNPGDAGRLELFDNFTFNSTASDLFPWYSANYQAIKSANVVIQYVPEIEMDETLKNRYLAEAKYLRALFYFNLVRAFGDVPKVTVVDAEFDAIRTSKNEIYDDVIIPDLLFAASTLPEKSQYNTEDAGRATRGAAKAILAKVYLYRGNWQEAANYALEVINSSQYSLEQNYSNAFSIAGQNGQESIFEIGALPFESTNDGGNQFANTQGVRGTPNRGWGFNRPSMSLINAFEVGDVRKDASVIFLGDVLDGIQILGDNSTLDTTWTDDTETTILEIECYNQKVWVPGGTTLELWGHNIKVMRYSEILLIAAEAQNEIGNSVSALAYLNTVRIRAGMPEATESSQELLRNIILNERRVELAMEGNRLYDLIRTGKAAQILGGNGFIVGKHELFPIPQSEIDLSGGTLSQNPGW
jgi:starch-binding outer membrane protein, SusD/RagB family